MHSALPTVFRPSRYELLLTALAVWALCLVTFRLPGRADPSAIGSLDLLAIAKLGVRLAVIVVFYFAWRWNPDHQAKRRVLLLYFPFMLFLAWACCSVLWSPLKTVSFGQVLGLTALLMLSAWIALSCRVSVDAAFVMKHLWRALLVFSVLVIVIHVISPNLSGLNRELDVRGANGLVRPTVAGSTAGLGFVLTLIAPRTIAGLRLGYAMVPALMAHAALLYLANSRTALGMTALVSVIGFLWFYHRQTHARVLVAISLVICASLLLDPGFVIHEDSRRASAEYLSRDQNAKQLSQFSGRMEMWEAVWEQFRLSPTIGHGYFVTSATGELDVWDGPANHTAHHIALQVLVSTGVIGAGLFFMALLRFFLDVCDLRSGDNTSRACFGLCLLIGLWYLGWSQTCISFIGPVLPESVVFFIVLGLAAGQVVRLRTFKSTARIATT